MRGFFLWIFTAEILLLLNTMNITFKQIAFIALFLTSSSVLLSQTEMGVLRGTVVGLEGELLPFVCIRLENTDIGTYSDIDGNFQIYVDTGDYTLIAEYVGYSPIRQTGVRIEPEKITTYNLKFKEETIIRVETVKPIIYCYPADTISLHLSIDYKGELTTTYPKYPDGGWKVTATPNGTLIDADDKEYYALYWEGEPIHPLTISEGTIVSKENTIGFLEKQLSQLGLNDREANEFIIYWLPILERNPFNVISFSFEAYENLARLNINPPPDQMIRVMMLYQGLREPISIPAQEMVPVNLERKGFTVVEWGGQEANIVAP